LAPLVAELSKGNDIGTAETLREARLKSEAMIHAGAHDPI